MDTATAIEYSMQVEALTKLLDRIRAAHALTTEWEPEIQRFKLTCASCGFISSGTGEFLLAFSAGLNEDHIMRAQARAILDTWDKDMPWRK